MARWTLRGRVEKAAGEVVSGDVLSVQDTPAASGWANLPARMGSAMVEQGQVMSRPFGPGSPIQPMDGFSGIPRAWDFPAGYNIAARPSRDNRVAFETLKALIDHYDLARMAIGHRIDDLRSLRYKVVAAEGITENIDSAIAEAKRRVKRPDGVHRFRSWLAMYLEDVLRYDAGCLYRRRDRAGRVIGLDVVSGMTIAPVIDYYGRRPTGDAPAYVQFANGVPWQWFRAQDMIYEPYRPQGDSPYGFAPLEAVLLNANTDIRFQMHFLSYFTEGTVPEGFASAPADVSSPTQLGEWQEYWDALLYGDDAAKHQIKWVPSGTELNFPRSKEFDEKFPLYLMRKTAAAYHVTPNDLGFTEDVNRATGETQVDVQFRIGTLPLGEHVQDIITDYLQEDCGLPVVFEFDTGQEKEDRATEAKAWQTYVFSGAASADEMREKLLGLPTDPARPTPRFIMQRGGAIPLTAIYAAAGEGIDPDTAAPADAHLDDVEDAHPDPSLADVPIAAAPLAPQETAGLAGAIAGVPGEIAPAVKALTGGVTATTGIVGMDLAGVDEDDPESIAQRLADERVDAAEGEVRKGDLLEPPTLQTKAAGLAVKADDTGRILMLQRAMAAGDPAAGRWEFPGGCLEPLEEPWEAAVREWQEETGVLLPPGQAVAGGWASGVYQGFVYLVPSEVDVVINVDEEYRQVLNPDDPDGDCPEVIAWWDPADAASNPALRAELAGDIDLWIPQVADAWLTDGAAIRKGLRQWRENSRNRVRVGKPPRLFVGLPDDLAAAVWSRLDGAGTREDVDAAFRTVVKAGGADPKGRWREGPATAPQHAYDLRLTDHYAPRVAEALGRLVPATVLDDAIARAVAAGGEVRKADEHRDLVRQAAVEALADGALTTDEMEALLRRMWSEAWAVGMHVGEEQLGAAGHVDSGGVGLDWDTWEPGDLDAAFLLEDGGLVNLLDVEGLTLKGLLDTTIDRIGNAIADGVAHGWSVDTIAQAIRSNLAGDLARAVMIAHTETARAMTEATLQTYGGNGIRKWNWLTASGACPSCAEAEAANPHDYGDPAPPGHPHCRCAVSPVVPRAS